MIREIIFSVPHLLWHGTSSHIKDPSHSHLLQGIWQWCCHYLFLWPKSIKPRIKTPNPPLPKCQDLPKLKYSCCNQVAGVHLTRALKGKNSTCALGNFVWFQFTSISNDFLFHYSILSLPNKKDNTVITII